MTLRTKLSLSIGIAIIFSVSLTIILTWQRVDTLTIESETSDYSSAVKNLENLLENSFLDYLMNKVQIVRLSKQKIRDLAADTRSDILSLEQVYPPSPERDRLVSLILKNHRDVTQQTFKNKFEEIFLVDEKELLKNGIPIIDVTPDSKNTKNESIKDILAELRSNGTFVLMGKKNSEEGYKLLYFLPVAFHDSSESEPKRILVSTLHMTSLFDSANKILDNHLDYARQTIGDAEFFDKSCIVIHDKDGKTLVRHGGSDKIENYLENLKAQSRSHTSLTEVVKTENGDYLCHCAWIKSFDWYFFAATPLSTLRKTSKELVSTIMFAGISILIMALITTTGILTRALMPLQYLRNWASKLASLDLSSQKNLLLMEKLPNANIPLNRNDEVGDLSVAFVSMSHELARNIRSTMQVMTKQKLVEGELAAARDIQIGILPSVTSIPSEPGFSIAAFLEPAREIGGDLYDCIPLAKGTKALVIGDVSGKGIPAALFMTMSVTLIRFALRSEMSPEIAMNHVNALLEEHNPGSMFVTLFLGIYTPTTGELIYVNGGHCFPIIMTPQGTVRTLKNISGPIVGAMPDLSYALYKDVLAPGEICFLYTDGLTEAMNKNKELYGEKRLIKCIASHPGASPQELQQAVFMDICDFRGTEPQSDDITMLTLLRAC